MPTLMLDPISEDNYINANEINGPIDFSGTTTDIANDTLVTVTVYQGSDASGLPLLTNSDATVEANGFNYTSPPGALKPFGITVPDGTYFVTASVTDPNTGAAEDGEKVTVDTHAPVLSAGNVLFSNPSSTLSAGDTVQFNVDTNEDVTVDGTPTLALSDGGVATYDAAQSTSKDLVFAYTVQEGDNTSDLTANGSSLPGSVTDLAGNAARGGINFDTGEAVDTAGTGMDTHSSPTIDFLPGRQDVQTFNTIAVLNGTVSDDVGVKGVEVFGSVNGAAVSDLGSATVNSDGTWTFGKDFGPGETTLGFLSAVATNTSGVTSTSNDPIALTLGVEGQDYTDIVDHYFRDGEYTGNSTYFDADNNLVYDKNSTTLANGDTETTTSGGYFFKHLPYSFYKDTTSSDGELLQETVHYKNGSNSIQAETDGQTLRTIKNQPDTLFSADPNNPGAYFANTQYVYSAGSGHDTIDHFQLTGANHDVLTLPASEAGHLASIIANSHSVAGGVELDFNAHDSLVLGGVTASQLRHELRKEVISGNTTDFNLA